MKLSKNKKRILKTRRVKKMVTFKGILVRTSNDFSAETLQARRERNDISRIIERKKMPAKNTLPAKLSFRYK